MIGVYLPKKCLADLFSEALEHASKSRRVWIPSEVEVYLVNLLVDRSLQPPCDVVRKIDGLLRIMPKDRSEWFGHLKGMGDDVVYWTHYWNSRVPDRIMSLAQEFYDAAASIGKDKPEAPVLRTLADKMPKYGPVLRETCVRLVA